MELAGGPAVIGVGGTIIQGWCQMGGWWRKYARRMATIISIHGDAHMIRYEGAKDTGSEDAS